MLNQSVADPPTYNGANGEHYPWLRKMEFKLRATKIRSQEGGIDFVRTELSERRYYPTYLPHHSAYGNKATSNPFTTADSLLKYLTEQLGDHNNGAKKSTETGNLKIGINEKCTDLYFKYQGLQPYYHMPDEVSEIRLSQGEAQEDLQGKDGIWSHL
ncbi:hypothetical protein B0A48_18646 [Cryoendolithus antarcticus]|uniref:Uncharacterized protein n=1 Tax=Cryoendolithus antarcticus TaxID=1507870 RepID=A0A1V8S966_9PEZI|nr:hypothetical protein B0A48_18646 [Cryoendolithus antarcticus]